VKEFLGLLSEELTVSSVLLAIVVWIVYAILTDRLVSRKRLEEKQAEAEKWREAYDTLSKAHDQTVKQNGLLQDQSNFFVHVVRALGTGTLRESDFYPKPSEEGDGT
jgi:uncharacterized membrane protein (DUF106 family)